MDFFAISPEEFVFPCKKGIEYKNQAHFNPLTYVQALGNRINDEDCPCHASRFNTDGSVIEGPALDELR